MKNFLIGALTVLVIGLGIYILIDKDIIKLGEEPIEHNSIEDEVNALYKKYFPGNENSLHYADSSKADEYRVVQAIYNLMERKGVEIPHFSCYGGDNGKYYGFYDDAKPLSLSQTDVENEIQNLFNKDINLSSIKIIDETDNFTVQFRNNTAEVFYCHNQTGMGVLEYSKMTSYVQEDDKLIIYDDFLKITSETGGYGLDDRTDTYSKESIFICEYEECPVEIRDSFKNDLANVYNYALREFPNAIGKYKHTFKKVNGNYYLISTELVG